MNQATVVWAKLFLIIIILGEFAGTFFQKKVVDFFKKNDIVEAFKLYRRNVSV